MILFRTTGLIPWLTLVTASRVYTGFNYGAFWASKAPKTRSDFERQFNLAKSLTGVPVPFDSARLFTSVQHDSAAEPIEAFQAAIDTNTSLFLGIWFDNIDQELVALDKAFEKHGQQLANLVVGISVGNEDIYQHKDCTGEGCRKGFSKEEVEKGIQRVRDRISNAPWKGLFKQLLPIGHVDIAAHAVVGDADFIGMTAYPYRHGDEGSKVNESFFGSLQSVKEAAGGKPVWVAETGWPFTGPQQGQALAGAEQMQKYWKEVGCSLFGKHNTWWFELENDSNDPGKQDWGIIDDKTRSPRIDLSCPKDTPPQDPESNTPTIPAPSSMTASSSTALPNASSSSSPSTPVPPSPVPPSPVRSSTTASSPVASSTKSLSTSPQRPDPTPAPMGTITSKTTTTAKDRDLVVVTTTLCVTVVNLNGSLFTVTTLPAGTGGVCASPTPIYVEPPNNTSSYSKNWGKLIGMLGWHELSSVDDVGWVDAVRTVVRETPLVSGMGHTEELMYYS